MNEQRTLILDANVDLQAAADGTSLPKIVIVAYGGAKMRPSGGWGDTVINLSGVVVPNHNGMIPILMNHNHEKIVGHAIVTIDRSITAHGVVSGTGTAAQEFLGSARNGFPWKSSIGLSVAKTSFLKESETATINGAAVTGPVTVVERSLLGEISVLPWPADQTSSVDVLAAANKANSTEASNMNNELSVETIRDEAAAETKRIHEIRKVCAGQHGDIEMQAISEGWGLEKVELQILRAERQAGPKFEATTSSGPVTDLDAWSAGMMIASGMSTAAEQELGSAACERGHKMRSWSLLDFARSCLQSSHAFRSSDSKDEMLRAAFSTSSFPVALANTLNKSVSAAYRTAPSAWRSVCDIRSVANFQTASAVRLSSFDDLLEVGPAGEIKDTSGGESYINYSVVTYARTFSLTRTQLINDSENLFAGVAAGLGRACARTLSNKFSEILLGNSGSHFSLANGNYQEGAGTVLKSSSLASATLLLRQMTDENNHLIDCVPRVLLCPPDLEVTAKELLSSTEVLRITDDRLPLGNIWRGSYELAIEPRLSQSSFSNYSAVGWYLAAAPSDSPMIAAVLQNRQSPVVEQTDCDWRTLGISWRVYYDAGFSLGDKHAMIFSKGSA